MKKTIKITNAKGVIAKKDFDKECQTIEELTEGLNAATEHLCLPELTPEQVQTIWDSSENVTINEGEEDIYQLHVLHSVK